MHLLFEGQLGLSTGVLGQSVFDIARVYIYIYVALDMFNIVPTVFLGLNKINIPWRDLLSSSGIQVTQAGQKWPSRFNVQLLKKELLPGCQRRP